MAVSIKDFTAGQLAYQVVMNTGRNKEPEIYEVKVKRVGRKYVTTTSGNWEHKYHCVDGNADCLEDNYEYGYKALLFPNKRAARNHISAYHLRQKITKFVSTMAFDNMELRKLERISDIIEEVLSNEQ